MSLTVTATAATPGGAGTAPPPGLAGKPLANTPPAAGVARLPTAPANPELAQGVRRLQSLRRRDGRRALLLAFAGALLLGTGAYFYRLALLPGVGEASAAAQFPAGTSHPQADSVAPSPGNPSPAPGIPAPAGEAARAPASTLSATLAATIPRPASGAGNAGPAAPRPGSTTDEDAGATSPPRLFRRSPTPTPVDPQLLAAYSALAAGRHEEAQQRYEALWRRQPKNLDVLLGLAALAARGGRSALAGQYYREALEADPVSADAQAGIAAHTAPGERDGEARLRHALAGQPTAAALHFMLGNLLAAEFRWSEARVSYLRADALSPGTPDILFNLAVTLDQLREEELAARYYARALAATGATAGFDRRQAAERLRQLQS